MKQNSQKKTHPEVTEISKDVLLNQETSKHSNKAQKAKKRTDWRRNPAAIRFLAEQREKRLTKPPDPLRYEP